MQPMLYDPARHEHLRPLAWDEERARTMIAHIVDDTESHFSPDRYWPMHPRDADDGDTGPAYPMYHGACGVIWALTYLASVNAAAVQRDYVPYLEPLRALNAAWLSSFGGDSMNASYLMGETGQLLLQHALSPSDALTERLASLIESNVDNPTRELMWGAPGTMLAALFLYEQTGDRRWANLFRVNEQTLRSQLQWSEEFRCSYWTQDMYGQQSTYLDAVHGFVATALPLIRGRVLLGAEAWGEWQKTIVNTVRQSAARNGELVNWRPWLNGPSRGALLMQYCHGAPGFVVCLANLPSTEIDDLLLAAGEAAWAAGPLRKGANLCHGTAGNGYAFLKLLVRTRDAKWLDRARAFAMHAIAQAEAEERAVGRMRYSLWTGDPGLAVYLWDCITARARFPTLDVFFGAGISASDFP